ncbi:MAG: hypothetical protein ACTTIR_09410, partial [Eggerthia catenaformis]|uniref:hypothetical protein n=1 Tax=Eggerthia catenaformis TaxID=31973 RepID=UPI003FA0AACC
GSCEKHEFDRVVKSYLKEVYSYNRVINTDGKDDIGLDMKVLDASGCTYQYQLTVQKSSTAKEKNALKNKIFKDVQKAKENCNDGYKNILFFFYSYPLTNKLKRDYKREALKDYEIQLEIIDANQIAEEAEDLANLKKSIYSLSDISEFKTSSFEDGKKNHLIYDLVSFGKTSEIKLEIVKAYILQELYIRTSLTSKDIEQSCTTNFKSSENNVFYNKLLQNLYNVEQKILYDKKSKMYSLTEATRKEISNTNEQINIEESHFVNQIGAILKENNIEFLLDDVLKLLKEFYIATFDKRIKSLDTRDWEDYNVPLSLLTNKGKLSSPKAKGILKSLFSICDENKYMQKICAECVFSSKVNIDDLEKYAREKKKVYIDTTIALYLLCYYYQDTDDYKSYYYKLSKVFCQFCKKNKIKLHITNRYLFEINSHIREAFNFIPFSKLQSFSSLGTSRNVLYNFYLHLYSHELIDYSYEEYLSKFKFGIYDDNTKLNQTISLFLENLGIEVIDIPKEYKIESSSKLITNTLAYNNKTKTNFALTNDAIMLDFLGDKDVDVHPIEPVFVTWDKIMFKVLKDYFNENPNAQKWMQFTPSQLIDRYSLLSFSINEETITKEMLALLSGDFIQQTYSLIDALTLIINPDEKVGREYVNAFVEMKNDNIYTISKDPDEESDNQETNIIDYIVHEITLHFKENRAALKNLFSIEELFPIVLDTIRGLIEHYSKYKQLESKDFIPFDNLISKYNQNI